MTPARARAIAALGARRMEERRTAKLRSREEFADRVADMAGTIARLESENRDLRAKLHEQERRFSLRTPASGPAATPRVSIRAIGAGALNRSNS